jgi:hypothetical protein
MHTPRSDSAPHAIWTETLQELGVLTAMVLVFAAAIVLLRLRRSKADEQISTDAERDLKN